MATNLDLYAAVRESRGAASVTDARIAARRLDVPNSVTALVNSVIANIR